MYTWNGYGFDNADFVPTQFFSTTLVGFSFNITYLYEQNYNGFFPVNVDASNNVTLVNPNVSEPISLVQNTVLVPLFLDDQIIGIDTQILNNRLLMFKNNATDIVSTYTQDPSSFVQNTISVALSGSGIGMAVETYAPFLISPELNFGLNDALKNWVNGPDLIKKLNSLFQSHQAEILKVEQGAKRISDFKKKLVKQQVALADRIRNIQGTTESFLASSTFTSLASAYPGTFGKLEGLLHNSNSLLSGKLASIMPTAGLDAGSSIEGIINKFIGNIKPTIVNPIDKLFVDIAKLDNAATGILDGLPGNGFESFAHQKDFTNQVVNLLNNIVAKIPITPTFTAPNPLTSPVLINNEITAHKNSILNINSSAATTTSQKAVMDLLKLMSINGPTLKSVVSNIVQNDSFHGGTFKNLSIIKSVLGTEVDQSITPPNVSQSPDPIVAQSQNDRSVAQTKADAPGVSRNFTRGSGINILDEVPLRPRNIPLDGSDGDYQVISGIPI